MAERAPAAGGEPERGVQLRVGPSSNIVLLVLAASALVIGAMFAVFIVRRDLTMGRRVSFVVFIAVLGAVLAALHHVRNTLYLVVDGEAVARSGLLADRTDRIPLDQVAAIEVDEPAYKRLFGMGDLRLEPASPEASAVRFGSLRNPRTVRAHLVQLVEAASGGASASATHSSSGSSRA